MLRVAPALAGPVSAGLDPGAILRGCYCLSAAHLRASSCRLTLIAEAGEHARFGSSVSAAELRRVSLADALESKLITAASYTRHEGDLLVGVGGRRPTRTTLGSIARLPQTHLK